MNFLKNAFVLGGSTVAVIVSLIWGIVEGGYEPWIVALLGAVGIVANLRQISIIGGRKRELTPEEKIAARDKWRPEFEAYFLKIAKENYRGDAIVHDVDRLDTYPDSGDEKGISSWFRVGLMGTYHKGILLGLNWNYIVERGGDWVDAKSSNSPGAERVILLGEVPYECIESVNFDGDDFYNKPHIFCHFDHGGEPYERLFYGKEFQLDPGLPYHYTELVEYRRQQASRWRLPKLKG